MKRRFGPPVFRGRNVILIVEDNHSLRHLLGNCLEIPGYETFVAENGMRAKEIYDLNRDSIKLIVSDIHTQELNGVALLLHVRKTSQAPIILMTGDSTLEPGEIKKLGASEVVLKPFTTRKIIETVQGCLGIASSGTMAA